MAWQKLLEQCDRIEKYINVNIVKEIRDLPDDYTVQYIDQLLILLESQRTRIIAVIAQMESSAHRDATEDVIDEQQFKFDKLLAKITSNLLQLKEDKSVTNSALSLISDVDDSDEKLNSIETFVQEIDQQNPPSISLLQHRSNQLGQIEINIGNVTRQMRSLTPHQSEQVKLKLDKTDSDSRISKCYTVLFQLIDSSNAKLIKSHESHKANSQVKLEAVKIPEFNGDPREWISFRDKFIAVIHNNDDLSKVIKFHYLQSAITDKNAPACIRSAPPTENGYDDAWKTLLETYNNDRLQLQSTFDSILKIKSMTDENPHDLQNLHSQVQSCLDTINRMGIKEDDRFSALIAHLTLSRLDKHTRDLFETSNDRKIPTFEALAEFLDARRKTLATINANQRQNNQVKSPRPAGGIPPPRTGQHAAATSLLLAPGECYSDDS